MEKFRISEKYRLDIRWKKAVYNRDGIVNLEGCYLSGPVMNEVSMNENDSILLDFSDQYMIFVPNYYIARLSWKQVERVDNIAYLYNTTLSNKFLDSVPKLSKHDYIAVDTKNHEDDKHQYHLTYPSYLVKRSGELHIFRSK